MRGIVPRDGGGGGVKRFMAPVAAMIAVLALTSSTLASGPAPDKATAKYEVDFLTDMIDHHAMAVEMAEMCVDKAVHEPLAEMCESIVTSQSAQIDLMQGWLSNWYGLTHEPEMTPGMMAQMERLASMSGERFEISFMKMMIRHHWQAMIEAEGCLDRAWHQDLLGLCGEIISAQSAEIRQLQDWLCEWYDFCGYFGGRRSAG
jgi:uncharacterized protein (DUF305 family)